MSVITTSYRAPSILRLAASPELTVSTLCPSRRKAMSSISQIERSSSQTRMLAMRSPSRGRCGSSVRFQTVLQNFIADTHGNRYVGNEAEAAQTKNKRGSFAQPRARPDLSFMGLRDLLDDRKPETGSTFKPRLERLKNFLGLLRAHAVTGIGKADLPVVAHHFEGDGQSAAIFHGLLGVLREIPEHLLDLVAVRQGQGFADLEAPLDVNASLVFDEAVFEQRERVFEKRHQVHAVKTILLAARIGEEVGDDVVEPLGFAGHDLEKLALLLSHLGAREHADGTG